MKKLFLFLFGVSLYAQSNALCPGATGVAPHCVILTYSAPTSGPTPTAYNLYSGGTKSGQCATPTTGTCTKIGTVAAGVLLFTWNSSDSLTLIEGATYFFVATSLNGTAESLPTPEVSATIPFLTPSSPANLSAIAK